MAKILSTRPSAYSTPLLLLLHVWAAAGAVERISQAGAFGVPELQIEVGKVFTHEGPLGTVTRELYIPYPKPNVSSVMSCNYVHTAGLRRFEQLTYQVFDDVYQDPEIRYSDDNGATWTDWQSDSANEIVKGQDFWWQWNPNGIPAVCEDGASGRLVRVNMLRGFEGGDPRAVGLRTLHHFTFYQCSTDSGSTWGPRKQLVYEEAPELAAGSSLEAVRETSEFLAKNQCWFYYNIVSPKGGGIVLPVSRQSWRSDEDGAPYLYDGPMCFLGNWNDTRRDYDWTASDPVTISRKVTGYLEEPWLAELQDGQLLLDMRGTNAGIPDAPGRHWYSLSKDGGKTWTSPVDWRYDDSQQFYSPATMAKIMRHSQTGKLYWFGNISSGPASGNSPRYPLCVAEIDESKPALRRSTLTAIDDFDPARHTPRVQFSNFFVFENRETHAFEIYLSPYGQFENVYQASVYKYTLQLR
ncbi:MAG: exo-alpha-sialidase [Candidatus Hydrogenedentes bacterium]|nr:exo-alpha-sialidase [Candidatus Hydrogenedentota bacterium]